MKASIFVLLVAATCVSAIKSFPPNMTWALLAWSDGTDDTTTAEMVDLDLFDHAALIEDFKKEGKTVICYYSAGTAEHWRPDVIANASDWEEIVVGKIDGWDELWLDITRLSELSALMKNRLDWAKERGCDGVEPDNTDCAFNPSDCWQKIRPAITEQQAINAQLRYNRWTAEYARSLGLAVGLKNTGEIISELQPLYDFSIAEQCIRYNECNVYRPFHANNKAIFGMEYEILTEAQCDYARRNFVQQKYCTGKDQQQCEEGAPIINCPSL